MTLIQLVSEQTMQNLLPVLRLKPKRLVHLATPRTVDRSALIANAVEQAGCSVELQTIRLSSMPDMRETNHAVRRAIEDAALSGDKAVVNFTGGTKLMSIGAFVAASSHKVSSLYVDTQNALFVDGKTASFLDELWESDWSFTPILKDLSVSVIGAANGCRVVTGGHDWSPFQELADHLMSNAEEEEEVHKLITDRSGFFGGREPRKPEQWLPYFSADMVVPERIAELAVQCGLFEKGSSTQSIRLPSGTLPELEDLHANRDTKISGYTPRYFAAVAPIQQSLAFLSGAWWEVIIADHMKRSGRFRDIRWSVMVGNDRRTQLEEDIVALEGPQVVYVSCKRGGHRSRYLPLLEEIHARSHSIGGAFTKSYLAIQRPPTGKTLSDLEKRAKELRIRLIYPEHLNSPDRYA